MNDLTKTNLEDTRAWLSEQGLFEFMVKAINGEIINNQRLSLRDRVHLAAKLSNKVLPDLKSCTQKTTVSGHINVEHSATLELLDSVNDQ